MKKTILTAMTILAVFGLSACGNVQTADKSVETGATTTSASVVTTVTTPCASTTVGEVTTAPESGDVSTSDTAVTTEPTETTAPIVTTSANETTTTTVATSKATTTKKTQKATTTTKKTTTTTAKKTTTTAPKKTEKVTTTTTAEKKVQLTQADIDRLVKELQEYSDDIYYNLNGYSVTEEMWGSLDGNGWITYDERIAILTPENDLNWTCPVHIIQNLDTYENAYKYLKEHIDDDYKTFPDTHLTLYVRWCPNGQGSTNICETRNCWDIYTLR